MPKSALEQLKNAIDIEETEDTESMRDRESGGFALAGRVSKKDVLHALNDDRELASTAIKAFLANLPMLKQRLRTANLKQDAEALEQTAHRLKGALAFLGVKAASKLALQIEEEGRARCFLRTDELIQRFESEIADVLPVLEQLAEAKTA